MDSKEQLKLDFYLGCFYNSFFGMVSPLYQKMVEEKVISNSIHCSETRVGDYLLISIGGYTHNAKVFQEEILTAIQEMDYFDEESFELDKKSSMVRVLLRDENIMNMIMPFVENVITYHYPYLDSVQDIEHLNFEEFTSMIRRLDFSHYTIVTIKEKESSS